MSFCNWKPMFSKLDDTLTCFATQYWLMTTYFWANDSSCSAALFRLCTFYCYKPSLFSGQVRFEIGVKWHQSGLRSYNMYRFIYIYTPTPILYTSILQYVMYSMYSAEYNGAISIRLKTACSSILFECVHVVDV